MEQFFPPNRRGAQLTEPDHLRSSMLRPEPSRILSLLERVCDALFPELQETGRWRGHRTWSLDGSSFSMPDTPDLQAHFGQPSAQAKGCGFPVAHLLALFHAGTGLLLRVVASPLRTHDMRYAAIMQQELDEGDTLLADRGFASFAHCSSGRFTPLAKTQLGITISTGAS